MKNNHSGKIYTQLIYEYVNTKSLLVTSQEDAHSVLISRPNVIFSNNLKTA